MGGLVTSLRGEVHIQDRADSHLHHHSNPISQSCPWSIPVAEMQKINGLSEEKEMSHQIVFEEILRPSKIVEFFEGPQIARRSATTIPEDRHTNKKGVPKTKQASMVENLQRPGLPGGIPLSHRGIKWPWLAAEPPDQQVLPRLLPYLKPRSCAYLERVDVYDTPPPPSKVLCFPTRNSIAQQVIICDIRIPGIRVTLGVIGRMTHVFYKAPLPPVWLYGMAPQSRIGLPRIGVCAVLRGYHPRARTITRIRETIGEGSGGLDYRTPNIMKGKPFTYDPKKSYMLNANEKANELPK
ncbi:hypothetical protein BJ322DRAFT_1221165 [Thelephora terrestris]|uniref:Uncharacterized protein n=1 Tax=Thelephora terrestris TaxID=56493 RepID=A0A9P6H7N7_9AGAM|nr:hypothetical protein BJ322DRAFT_1221165 [Thelephora terrestris]